MSTPPRGQVFDPVLGPVYGAFIWCIALPEDQRSAMNRAYRVGLNPIGATSSVALLTPPAGALAAVFQHNTAFKQRSADAIGPGIVLGIFRRAALCN